MNTRSALAALLTAALTACAGEPFELEQSEAGGAAPVETAAGGATSAATSAAAGGATVAAPGGSSAAQATTEAGGVSPVIVTEMSGWALYRTAPTGGAPSTGGASSVGGTGGTTAAVNTYTIIACPNNCREINLKDQDRGVVPTCNLRCGTLETYDRYGYLFGFRAHDCLAAMAVEPITPKQMEQWDLSPVCAP